jgi:hypothetical protein
VLPSRESEERPLAGHAENLAGFFVIALRQHGVENFVSLFFRDAGSFSGVAPSLNGRLLVVSSGAAGFSSAAGWGSSSLRAAWASSSAAYFPGR